MGLRPHSRPALAAPLVAATVACLAAGCSNLPTLTKATERDLAWTLAGAGALPQAGEAPLEDPAALMRVTDEMRSFAVQATRGISGLGRRIEALSAALGARGLHLQYDPGATLTAAEAFAQRRVNCLSYALLFVALAREVGIPAQFNEVDVPPIWDVGDEETLVLFKHVNVKVNTTAPFFQVVDLSEDEYDPAFDQRAIPDQQAEAQFFNNRAVELRLQGQHAQALRYHLRAVQLAPQVDFLWANLAGAFLQRENLVAARVAVAQALELRPSNVMAYNVAAQIYERLGEPLVAAEFRRQGNRALEQNPYFHYQRALAALRRREGSRALDEVRRAISLGPKEHRFYFLAAVIEERLGQTQLSGQYLRAALKLSPDSGQQHRYQSKFAQLSSRG